MNPPQHNPPQRNTSVISISEIKSSNVRERTICHGKRNLSLECKSNSVFKKSIKVIQHINIFLIKEEKSHDHINWCRKNIGQNSTLIHKNSQKTGNKGKLPQLDRWTSTKKPLETSYLMRKDWMIKTGEKTKTYSLITRISTLSSKS